MHATAIVTRRARSAFADGNVDRPVESANTDIPARHRGTRMSTRSRFVYPMPMSAREGVDAGPLAVEKPGTRA